MLFGKTIDIGIGLDGHRPLANPVKKTAYYFFRNFSDILSNDDEYMRIMNKNPLFSESQSWFFILMYPFPVIKGLAYPLISA